MRAETVGAVIREVGLAEGVKTGYGGHEVVIDPYTAHRVVNGGVDHHGLFVRIDVCDLLVHLEEVAVTLGYDILAETGDSRREVEEYGQSRVVDAETCVATFFGGTRGHVTGHEVTERGVATFKIIVAILFGYLRCLDLFFAETLHILFLLGNPYTAVVTQ